MGIASKLLGTAAAAAACGTAIYALTKVLKKKDPLYVADVEFAEKAEDDDEAASAAEEAYEEGLSEEMQEADEATEEEAEETKEEAEEESGETDGPAEASKEK